MSETGGEYGALAAALAKAQASFPSITRGKEVTVKTKTGGSYTFKYAPLDSILDAVRKPLAENGLAMVQTLDEGDLVTMLLHDGGARIIGRTPLPETEGIQAYGSAITYLRRYSIQALLGIAAEEDDDGNQAEGNRAVFRERNPRVGAADYQPPAEKPPVPHDGGLIGIAAVGKPPADFEIRAEADGGQAVAFRLTDGRKSMKVVAHSPLAEALHAVKANVIDQRVQCWGVVSDETFTPKGSTKEITYQVLTLNRIETAEFTLPSPDVAAMTVDASEELDAIPLFGEVA